MNPADPDPTAADLVEQARHASTGGDTQSAMALLRAAHAAAVEWHVPPYLLAAELAQAGRVDEAEAAFATAVLLEPGFEIARFQLGLLQFSSARVAAALVTWQPLLLAAAEPALKRFVEGLAALAADDVAGALTCLEAGIAANATNDALNEDMRLLMRRLASLPGEAPGEAPGDVQSMLDNYQRQGSLH